MTEIREHAVNDGSEDTAALLARISGQFVAGRSSLPFRTGAAVDTSMKSVSTLAVVMLEEPEETRDRVFAYLQRLEWSTQQVRISIVTDTRAIKAIRPHGWLVEHVMPKDLHQRLADQEPWSEYAEKRIHQALLQLDPAHLLIPGPRSVERRDHLRLCRTVGVEVPFDLLSH